MSNLTVIEPSHPQTATLVFLHGLGDSGESWASLLSSITPPSMKIICPTAREMPVTLNGGQKMASWFDIKSLELNGPEDERGITKATKVIHGIIDGEVKRGIASSRIVLGGFSQGGALALYSSLKYKKKLGGVVALSCWLPLHQRFPEAVKCPKDLAIMQAHGDSDSLIQLTWGELTAKILGSFMSNVKFMVYRGLGHGSSEEELYDVKKFIAEQLGF